MAYSELIKNFSLIRGYMREFYLYGFKSRNEYTGKSARSYDDERRRLESWLGGYMQFRQTPGGKNVFLSIDSRVTRHNPLYAAWKTRSFTDGDITLHFILFDILHDPAEALTLNELGERIDGYLSAFRDPKMFDASTLRKKLKEYAAEGIIVPEKRGKTLYYRRAETPPPASTDILDFFSETAPCGVIGSFLLDKAAPHADPFAFKHHYITSALDSGILCSLFSAISEKESVFLEVLRRRRGRTDREEVVPLCVRISVQSGRQYLMAYEPARERITSFRTDNILSVRPGTPCGQYEQYRRELDLMRPHLWGVSTENTSGQPLEHIEFTVEYTEDEKHIHGRLEREKRCGTVEKAGENSSCFSADVFDAREVLSWVRTFICRVTRFSCSNPEVEARFREDLRQMYRMYGLEGGDEA